MQAQVQPEFVLQAVPARARAFGPWLLTGWSRLSVTVENKGFPISGFHCEPLVVLDATLMDGNEYGEHDVLVPMLESGMVQLGFRSSQGTLATIRFDALSDELRACKALSARLTYPIDKPSRLAGFPANESLFHIYLITLADITYTDALGQRHEELYIVGPTITARVPADLAGRFLADYNAKTRAGVAYSWWDSSRRIQDDLTRLWTAVHARFVASEIVWPDIEGRLGFGSETGVYVNNLEWPFD
jgi:hypothetical protein